MTRQVHCSVDDIDTDGLDFPPWPGDAGKRVFNHVGKPAWQRWLAHQTMLINEHRISPMNPQHRAFLEAEIRRRCRQTCRLCARSLSLHAIAQRIHACANRFDIQWADFPDLATDLRSRHGHLVKRGQRHPVQCFHLQKRRTAARSGRVRRFSAKKHPVGCADRVRC